MSQVHRLSIRVYYEDTDFSGVVYHASYLRFMERGRTDFLRLLGVDHRALFEEAGQETPGFAFVVRSMVLDFLRPARMDDVLDIVTWPVAVKGANGIAIGALEGPTVSRTVAVLTGCPVSVVTRPRTVPVPVAGRSWGACGGPPTTPCAAAGPIQTVTTAMTTATRRTATSTSGEGRGNPNSTDDARRRAAFSGRGSRAAAAARP